MQDAYDTGHSASSHGIALVYAPYSAESLLNEMPWCLREELLTWQPNVLCQQQQQCGLICGNV
jgi:hypothetical protein